uniref:N-acetyltransferase domain-containing protein n=1 Tax=Parascaris univalens TaxID=6257 RepID=A0A915C1V1_PARUN
MLTGNVLDVVSGSWWFVSALRYAEQILYRKASWDQISAVASLKFWHGSVNMDDDFDYDSDPASAPDLLERLQFVRGSKEDFSAMLHASNQSNQWVRKFRDYDCYEKILGTEKLHDTVAKTKYGEYVGSCICFQFPEMSFVAIYYVCPNYRTKGVGTRLFASTVTDSLRKGNIGLHAVQEMSPVYEKLGFAVRANWLVDMVRMTDVNMEKIHDLKSSLTVKGARDVGLEKLVEYDTTVNKTKREPFVRHWAYERNDSVCKVICPGFLEIAKWLYVIIS